MFESIQEFIRIYYKAAALISTVLLISSLTVIPQAYGIQTAIAMSTFSMVIQLLNHPEPRLRELCSDVLHLFVRFVGTQLLEALLTELIAKVRTQFERVESSRITRLGHDIHPLT